MTESKSNVINEVYDEIFNFIARLFKETGPIRPMLMGIDVKNEKLAGIHSLSPELMAQITPALVTGCVGQMLEEWPVVVHVCEAWVSTEPGKEPSKSDTRRDALVFVIYTQSEQFIGTCLIDHKSRSIEKGELAIPMGGRMTRPSPVVH